MDRTVLLNDKWHCIEGEKAPSKRAMLCEGKDFLPFESSSVFTLKKKFICPKQINDTVKIYFTGEYSGMKVFAGMNLLEGASDEEGRTVFDITAFIGRGIVPLTVVVDSGRVDGFYYSVKRKV